MSFVLCLSSFSFFSLSHLSRLCFCCCSRFSLVNAFSSMHNETRIHEFSILENNFLSMHYNEQRNNIEKKGDSNNIILLIFYLLYILFTYMSLSSLPKLITTLISFSTLFLPFLGSLFSYGLFQYLLGSFSIFRFAPKTSGPSFIPYHSTLFTCNL